MSGELGDSDSHDPAPTVSNHDDGRPGDFERYALIAALTLVVLALLVWDRWHEHDAPPPPAPDRALRVRIGGSDAAFDRAAAGPVPAEKTGPRSSSNPGPAPPPPPAPAPAARTVIIRSGDTLFDIARRELGSAERAQEIADLNGLSDPGRIRIGQVLKLPAK